MMARRRRLILSSLFLSWVCVALVVVERDVLLSERNLHLFIVTFSVGKMM